MQATEDDMPKYRVNVYRKQKWTFEVEAADKDSAKVVAEHLSDHEPAHDDWAYDTTADRIHEEQGTT